MSNEDQSSESVKLSYFRITNSLLYSYLISLPLLVLYEALIYLTKPDSEEVIRISVDVWIKMLFAQIGYNVLSITLILVALIGIVILYREKAKIRQLKISYFFLMLLEASFYAFILALIITQTVTGLLQTIQNVSDPISSLSVTQQIALSLGAGLYEELFFRVILVSLLIFILGKLFPKKGVAIALAIITAAFIFSAVHYVGEFGDAFTMGSFLFRFLFGLGLNGIYVWRGFGMAAWTHAIYDIMVVAYLN